MAPIIQSFSDLGLGAALVQRREIGSAHFSTVFLLNVGVGVALTLVGAGLSWPAAWFFHEPALQPVAIALSLNFLLGSLTAAQRRWPSASCGSASSPSGVAASALGGARDRAGAGRMGVWSLVAQSLITSFAAVILIWRLWPGGRACASIGRLLGEMWP